METVGRSEVKTRCRGGRDTTRSFLLPIAKALRAEPIAGTTRRLQVPHWYKYRVSESPPMQRWERVLKCAVAIRSPPPPVRRVSRYYTYQTS